MFKKRNAFFLFVLISIVSYVFYYHSKKYSFTNTYEDRSDTLGYVYVDTLAHSGKYANLINQQYRYSKGFNIRPSQFNNKKIKRLRYQLYAYTPSYSNQFYFVTHVVNDSIIYYKRNPIYLQNHTKNIWQKYKGEYEVNFNYDWKENMELVFYIYNEKGNQVFIDDFSVHLYTE